MLTCVLFWFQHDYSNEITNSSSNFNATSFHFSKSRKTGIFWWLPFHAVSSLYLIFSILVRRCFASLYKRQWPIFIVSWIHFFSRMAPGLDKLMWLLTINITHLFQKMSSCVSEIDTKIFCRIIFRQNDAHFFVHNWKKKDLEEKQKRMQRKRSFLIDRCALRIRYRFEKACGSVITDGNIAELTSAD